MRHDNARLYRPPDAAVAAAEGVVAPLAVLLLLLLGGVLGMGAGVGVCWMHGEGVIGAGGKDVKGKSTDGSEHISLALTSDTY